uniref:PPM-type phosphatase domain-containing protein n=1 Tax=Timema monikensis TaxID=170555 RepID=A0A7R9EC69_9NEOP|nr:unnamed protein product [Timema monikensis]
MDSSPCPTKRFCPDANLCLYIFFQSRVLATIGVTRGFGDHDLRALNSTPVKPFLSSQPEVQILDIMNENIDDSDLLIMGTDGLWDVTSNERAVETVKKSLSHFSSDNDTRKYRYLYLK